MDPVTTAIVAAIAAGVISGVTEVGKKVIVDAYDALKNVIEKKFGDDSDLVDAVEKLEKKPDSPSRKGTVQEEVAAVKADQDEEILAAAKALLDKIKEQPGGEQHIQQVIGSSYVAMADRGGTARVSVGQSPEEKKKKK